MSAKRAEQKKTNPKKNSRAVCLELKPELTQIYDYKGFKHEEPVIKKGMTQELKEMQKDMDEKMDVLINTQKNNKPPLQKQPKEQQVVGQIGKMDKDSQPKLKKLEEPNGASLTSDKTMVSQKTKDSPLDSLHTCQSCCEAFTPRLGALFTFIIWSCFLIYLYFNPDEMEYVLPT
nr:testis-expressed protein 35 isoform X8 [Peromyscus maniculatus bairdii]